MDNREKIKKIRTIIQTSLSPLIDNDYVLLDIPNHRNIGDNLIWDGELQFLSQCISHKLLYSSNVFNFQEEKIQSVPIILFHGGGNFGDLYRVCQEFRVNIIKKYHHKRIIVFPQTVWYNDEGLLKTDSVIINEHPDLFICCRDNLSFDTLQKYISKEKLLLLPDMAFFCNIETSCTKTGRKLFMFRSDQEIDRSIKPKKKNEFDVKDWPTFSYNKIVRIVKLVWNDSLISLSKYLQKTFLSSLVDPEYGLKKRNNRERYIKQGIAFFNKYDEIYTTRLHGLILGVLMEKKIIIVDNKYGKCINFYKTWLRDFENIQLYYKQ